MTRKLRVLIVTADLSVGGGQQVVYELAKNLNKEEVEFAVLCYAGHADSIADKKAQNEFYTIYLEEKGPATFSKIRKILKTINEYKPDVVHAHLGGVFYSVIWAILFHGRLVITAHTKPNQAFSKRIEPGIRFLLKKKRAYIVGVSEGNKSALNEYFSISDNRIQCVNNGVDLDRFYQKEHDCFTFINVARQDENKNQGAIIRCFGKVHEIDLNTRLFLLGDGPTHEKLVQLALETVEDKSIVLTGLIANTEDYYAISDVYIQSSHREAMPMSMLEAMGAGLPLISTNVGGVCDIIDSNGIIVPDNQEEKLFEAMMQMRNASKKEIREMGRISKGKTEEYSAREMAKKYMRIYEDISGGNTWDSRQ